VVVGVEPVVAQLFATARPASSPYDAFQPAPAVVATSGPTY
ncbi:hypothetical protein A2U01_0115436, partial [Trifolium medium]|nr:hypothetical protein [Trifolium medium]